jgi:hypothetical protein
MTTVAIESGPHAGFVATGDTLDDALDALARDYPGDRREVVWIGWREPGNPTRSSVFVALHRAVEWFADEPGPPCEPYTMEEHPDPARNGTLDHDAYLETVMTGKAEE